MRRVSGDLGGPVGSIGELLLDATTGRLRVDSSGGTTTVTGIATAGSTQQGAIANPAYTDPTGAANGTMIALLKGIYVQLAEINAKTPPLTP